MSRTRRRTKYTPEWITHPYYYRLVDKKTNKVRYVGTLGIIKENYWRKEKVVAVPTKEDLAQIKSEYQRENMWTMSMCTSSFRKHRNRLDRSRNKQLMKKFLQNTDGEYDEYNFNKSRKDVLWHYW